MGYSYYVLPDGREAGYAVDAVCDYPDCEEEIDRGLGYLCGIAPDGWRDPKAPGCGKYFCSAHLFEGTHDCPNPEPEEELPPDQVLDCGCLIKCRIEDGTRVMKVVACRAGCPSVAVVLGEADRQGKPAEVREL